MAFIVYGRPACGNCQNLHELIDAHRLSLPNSKYVFINVLCDDPAQSKAFRARYTPNGNTLPFVVVTDDEGKQLAMKTGFGSADEYSALLREAKKAAK